jgi:hypothetical protein
MKKSVYVPRKDRMGGLWCRFRDKKEIPVEGGQGENMRTMKNLVSVTLAFAVLLLAASVLTGYTAHAGSPTKAADTRRVFYLTKGAFTGDQTLTACTTGFHMASIWEINQTAVLRYDNTLGRTDGDSVYGGPPSLDPNGTDATAIGWVRTGNQSRSCQNWTSGSFADVGSVGVPAVNINTSHLFSSSSTTQALRAMVEI